MPKDNSVRLSKSLSYVLRHGAEEVGLKIRPDGYIRVEDLLRNQTFRDISLQDVITVVENNDKKRFEITSISNELFIRACQGHTIKTIQDEYLLQPIVDASLYPTVVHGTYEKLLSAILEIGLSRMKRNHIHMATSINPKAVVSGARQSAEVFIVINLAKALEAGIPFYLSSNGVVLSPGLAETGLIPSEFFEAVVRRDDFEKSKKKS